jgi:hypothetical protein
VAPYLIARVTDAKGKRAIGSLPVVAGESAERAIDPQRLS